MREILLYIATSLDGKIARKDHSLDWLPPIDEAGDDYGYKEMLDSVDTVLMGYRTYEICMGLGEWPYKHLKSYVFSRNADKPVIPEVELVNEDPVTFTGKLKEAEGKNIWLIGGGDIIRQLHDGGLIDKYMIATVPVILGEGIELFPGIKKEQKLSVVHHKAYPGLIMTHYAKTAE